LIFTVRSKMKFIGENVRKVESKGSIPHEKVLETIVKYHFFILPTLGENFGHVFVEALACGCPLIISNRTPWLELEKKEIGWDLDLNKSEKWIDTINHCINLDDANYTKISEKAREFIVKWLEDSEIESNTLEILNYGSENSQINAN
jgi:glycosyltransferase involved in cell wall biosynthesis